MSVRPIAIPPKREGSYTPSQAAHCWFDLDSRPVTDQSPSQVRALYVDLVQGCEAGAIEGVETSGEGFTITISGLKAFAEARGERPDFLFAHKYV